MIDRGVRDGNPPLGLRISGYALALWSLAYMWPHLVFALGSDWGLSAVKPGVSELSYWTTINWIASAILTIAALLGVAFVWLWGKPAYKLLLLGIGCFGCSIAVAHGIYGVVDRLLTVTGLKPGQPMNRESWILWDLLVFEPWFLIEGILIGVAGWHFLTSRDGRRWWLTACASGIAISGILALAGMKVG